MHKLTAPLRALIAHAFTRWDRIGIAFSSTGLDLVADDRLRSALEAMSLTERNEVSIVLRELEWRMSELERTLQIRSELFAPADARHVNDLIEESRQPSLVASMMAAASYRSARRQRDHEAAAAPRRRDAADAAVVALDDLAHQREPEPDAAGALRVARQAEERLEDAFAVRLGHARAVVRHADLHARRALVLEVDADLAAAVATRVLQQVAQRAPQQAFLAVHGRGRALDLRVDARALLHGQREQVDVLEVRGLGRGLEAAGEQHLVDEAVELGDVGVDLGAQVLALGLGHRRVAQQRGGHLQARQRRTQLVAGVGQQALVGAHQRLDALGRVVEAVGQRGDLVAAFDLDAAIERALAERDDAALERLEPARQPAHERVGTHRDREEQHATSASRLRPGDTPRGTTPGEQERRRPVAVVGQRSAAPKLPMSSSGGADGRPAAAAACWAASRTASGRRRA